MNSLSQGGLPVDVAETIAWFAAPDSTRPQRQRRPGLRPEPDRRVTCADETQARRPARDGRRSTGAPRSARSRAPACCRSSAAAARRAARPRARRSTASRSTATRLADYCRVCGFTLRDDAAADLPARARLPAADAADGRRRLPVPAARPRPPRQRDHPAPRRSGPASGSTSRSAPTDLRPHPKGRAFSLSPRPASAASWSGRSAGRSCAAAAATPTRRASRAPSRSPRTLPAVTEWKLGGDLGRRYAGVSGDRNPIHMHALSAKAFGFPRAIAHGMWSQARCLAQLEGRIAGSLVTPRVASASRCCCRPRVRFAVDERDGGAVGFALRDAREGRPSTCSGICAPR